MPAVLEALHLRKSYRQRTVVVDVSFVVQAGEIVGLLGANGAGKTTSFHITAGLVPQDSGSVLLQGVDMQRLPLHRRARLGLAYLPQEPSVFRGLSAYDNLLAVLEIRGGAKSVARSKDSTTARQQAAQQLLKDYHLQHVHHTLGSHLSGGERRRLEMARALIASPCVLLLDEPFAGVDPLAVAEIKGFIQQVRQRGIGVLLTDHNVRETLRICDRAYIIEAGRILLEGSPASLVANPQAKLAYLGADFSL